MTFSENEIKKSSKTSTTFKWAIDFSVSWIPPRSLQLVIWGQLITLITASHIELLCSIDSVGTRARKGEKHVIFIEIDGANNHTSKLFIVVEVEIDEIAFTHDSTELQRNVKFFHVLCVLLIPS